MGRLEVAVIGAGTAGSAAAILLARAGHRVSLFEAVAEPSAVGAGIMLQPSGMAVLARLSVLSELLARGSVVDRLSCVTATRPGRAPKVVLDLHYRQLSAGAFGLGMHRGALFNALFRLVQAEPLVTAHCGLRIEALRRSNTGATLIEEDGSERGPFPLVVIADGARSRLRRHHPGLLREREYAWGALWAILEDPERRFDGVLHQVVDSTTEMLGLLPSGLGPTGQIPLVSMFWSIHKDRLEAWREAGLEAWRARALALVPQAEPLLAQIRRAEDLLFARYHDVVMKPWHTDDGVVFLGDAAHSMSPQLGQGANIALVDAAALADALEAHDDVKSALAAYSRVRKQPLAYYQWATRFLTPFFQSERRILGQLRDLFMGPMCRLPFSRDKMVRTMCGLERGLIAPPLPMPSLTTGARTTRDSGAGERSDRA